MNEQDQNGDELLSRAQSAVDKLEAGTLDKTEAGALLTDIESEEGVARGPFGTTGIAWRSIALRAIKAMLEEFLGEK